MNATSCTASGAWSGPQSLTASLWIKAATTGSFRYALQCTGDGGSTSASVTMEAWLPIPFSLASYDNYKTDGLSQIEFPVGTLGYYRDGPLAYALADFSREGYRDLFTASQNYGIRTAWDTLGQTVDQALSDPRFLSDFSIWRKGPEGAWSRRFTAKGCLHPRKALVTDFNADGYPDIYVACHGYDASPYPGELNRLMINDRNGSFTISEHGVSTKGEDGIGGWVFGGFTHGAAAGDLNGDGLADLVLTTVPVSVMINRGNGSFRLDRSRISLSSDVGYNSVELVDVNNDKILDLLAGGAESRNATTMVTLGSPSGFFSSQKLLLPSVSGRRVVLDFTLAGKTDRPILFVGRTADGSDTQSYYSTTTVQRIDLTSLESSTIIDTRSTPPNLRWVAWWIPGKQNGQDGILPYSSRFPELFVPSFP